MRVILFGMGNVMQRWITHVDLETVVAFSDNNVEKQDTVFLEKPVISPNTIMEYLFDYVVIFNKTYEKQISSQLVTELGISEDKVITWQNFFEVQDKGRRFFGMESMNATLDLIDEMGLEKILDIQIAFQRFSVFTKYSAGKYRTRHFCVDGYSDKEKLKPIFNNIYSDVYSELDDHGKSQYDVLMFVDLFLNFTLDSCVKIIERTQHFSRYVILTLPHTQLETYRKWQEYDFTIFGGVRIIAYNTFQLILIDKLQRRTSGNMRIFVATHVPFILPDDKNYIPIHVGKSGKECLGFSGDDIGDNISSLNTLLNECTLLYWMWKQARCCIIGLNHYRRYLLSDARWYDRKNILDEDMVNKILERHDIIMGQACFTYPCTVSRHLQMSVCEDAWRTGMTLVQQIILQKHEDYLEAFEEVFSGYAFFPCNLFVTRKEIMDQYCEWLFDIIIEAAERIDVSQYDPYSKRIIGFIAERLFTVWLMKQNLKIKELPILITE